MDENRQQRSRLPLGVTGKGKRKVDDIPTFTDNGNVHLLFLLYCVCVFLMFMTFVLRFSFAAYVSHGTFAGDHVASLLSPSPTHVVGVSLRG